MVRLSLKGKCFGRRLKENWGESGKGERKTDGSPGKVSFEGLEHTNLGREVIFF